MSLCLALLLAVIAINWWQGWKPFKHPFQMPGARLNTFQPFTASAGDRAPDRSSMRESRRAPSSAALTKQADVQRSIGSCKRRLQS